MPRYAEELLEQVSLKSIYALRDAVVSVKSRWSRCLHILATGLHESESTKTTLLVNQDEGKAPDMPKQVSAMAKDHPPTSKLNLMKAVTNIQRKLQQFQINIQFKGFKTACISIHYRPNWPRFTKDFGNYELIYSDFGLLQHM